MPITISGFSVSIRQWNSGTLLTTDWKFKFMILNLFCFSNLFFFLTGVEVLTNFNINIKMINYEY